MVRVAINGYGRIGRVAHRIILEKFSSELEVVAINAGSSTDVKGWMYLLKYDTVYGPLYNHELNVDGTVAGGAVGGFVIDGKTIPVFSQKDPMLLPWKALSVDVVIEATGVFRTKDKLQLHLQAGAKHAVLSAPAKGSNGENEIATYVLSVNDSQYNGETMISNASCTTNCIAPVMKILVDHFGIEKAMMTTVHGYTSDQRLQDGGHKDYRRARAAAQNIIPTSTGATTAAAKALPALTNIFTGLALRVPVSVGSLSDITALLKKDVTVEEVNGVFKEQAKNLAYKGILTVTEEPLVSSDIIGSSYSAVVDLSLTQVVGGNMVKVIAWYDNEYGYATRLVEMTARVGKGSAPSV